MKLESSIIPPTHVATSRQYGGATLTLHEKQPDACRAYQTLPFVHPGGKRLTAPRTFSLASVREQQKFHQRRESERNNIEPFNARCLFCRHRQQLSRISSARFHCLHINAPA